MINLCVPLWEMGIGARGKGMVPKNKTILYKDLMLKASGLFLYLKFFMDSLFFLQERSIGRKNFLNLMKGESLWSMESY